MNNQENIQVILDKINPALKDKITDSQIESLLKYTSKENVELSKEDEENVSLLIKNAKEIFEEDMFAEPLNYLATSRFGLRVQDLEKLMGEDWSVEEFSKNCECFGVPFMENRSSLLILPYMKFKELVLNSIDKNLQVNYQEDIAFYLLKLPVEDPFRSSELFYHSFKSGNVPNIISQFSKLNGQQLITSADIIGSSFCFGKDIRTIELLAEFEGIERLAVLRRMLNEVFLSILNNTTPEKADSYIDLINEKIRFTLGESASIENMILYSIGGLRKAQVKLAMKNPEETKTYFEDALQNMDKLFNTYKNANDFTWDEVEGVFNVGMITLDMQQPKTAEITFNIAFNIFEVKERGEATDSLKKFYIASWYINVCKVLLQSNNKEGAEKIFEKGKKILTDTIKIKSELNTKEVDSPKGEFELMNMYLDYADMSAAFSQKEEALSNYDNALIIGERLAEKYKDNVQMRFTPSITLSKLGKLYADSGDTKKAKDYYEQALDVRVKLLEENPNDIRLLNDVAVMYITIAEFLSHTPDKAKMIEYLEKRKLVVEKIMTVDPSENSLIMLLDAYLMLIDYYFANNKPQDCANNIEDLKKHLAGLMGKQVSENVLTRIALMHLKSAQLLKDMNNPEQVENNLNAALQLWQQLYDATKKNIYKDNIDKAKEMFNK